MSNARRGVIGWRRFAVVALFSALILFGAPRRASADDPVRLPGHVLSALPAATRVFSPAGAPAFEAPITLAVTLKRSDEAGFQAYLRSVSDKSSPNFQHFASTADLARRFGPSQAAYDAVLAFLTKGGLTLVHGSADRLTITVNGTRAQIDQAFALNINDYVLNGQSFHANDQDPAVPSSIAAYVQGIAGLSDLARPTRTQSCAGHGPICAATFQEFALTPGGATFIAITLMGVIMVVANFIKDGICGFKWNTYKSQKWDYNNNIGGQGKPKVPDCTLTDQKAQDPTVGLLEFDSFNRSDVVNWLNISGLRPDLIDQLSVKAVNGGVAAPGPNEPEVLIDIGALMAVASDPAVNYVVYEAPFAGSAAMSFISQISAMTNDGVDVISNSWTACEDEMSLVDAQTIDSAIAQAAAAGISVVNAAGDNAGACSDGTPSTVAVPADSPNATAVGATSVAFTPAKTYGGEALWSHSSFGQSVFFQTPPYQQGVTPVPGMRSVPDIVFPADPVQGIRICEAHNGGCPTGSFYGGTSLAAPEIAAMAVLLNVALGHRLGNMNPVLYGAGGGAYHSPSGMGSDFQHAGLGSPIPDRVLLSMEQKSVGAPSGPSSDLSVYPPVVPADGQTKAYVVVYAHDVNGHFVGGQNVTLTCSCGSSLVSPATAITDQTAGAAVFAVTDTTTETITYSATLQGLAISDSANVTFGPLSGKNGSVEAVPSTVGLNQFSTVTVLVRDGQNPPQPVAGKQINLTQGIGHSTVQVAFNGPGVTDANGQVQYRVFDSLDETVIYSAFDVTDGLTIGSTQVTFTQNPPPLCITGSPTAQNGYAFTGYATGFLYDTFFCDGPLGLAFDSGGNLNVINFGGQRDYRFGPGGGIANTANQLPNNPGPLRALTYGKDGELYATETDFPGAVWQLDPLTGAELRKVYDFSGNNFAYFCPLGIATDPISGDLFVSQEGCFGTHPDAIVRIQNPSSATATGVAYATPGLSDGLAFGPDGTLYAASNTGDLNGDTVVAISRTGVVTPLANVAGADGIAVGPNPANPAGPPLLLVTSESDGTITRLDLSTQPIGQAVVYSGGSRGDFAAVGRDGCFYATQTDQIIRLTNADGTCSFLPTSGAPQLALSPILVTPNPATGSLQTFTAKFQGVSVPAGTPVTFTISGANPQAFKQVNTDANGAATFTYTGAHAGADTVVASGSANGTLLSSNSATLTWTAGKNVTSLTLNGSATTGAPGQSVPLQAILTDVTQVPPAPIANATVQITLQGGSCSPMTNASGVATCNLTVSGPINSYTLTASYAGTAAGPPVAAPEYTASTASTGFLVTDAQATATPTPTMTPTPSGSGTPTPTPTPSGAASPTPTPTATRTPTPTLSSPAATATATATPTATLSPLTIPTATPVLAAVHVPPDTGALSAILGAVANGRAAGGGSAGPTPVPAAIAPQGQAVRAVISPPNTGDGGLLSLR